MYLEDKSIIERRGVNVAKEGKRANEVIKRKYALRILRFDWLSKCRLRLPA